MDNLLESLDGGIYRTVARSGSLEHLVGYLELDGGDWCHALARCNLQRLHLHEVLLR